MCVLLKKKSVLDFTKGFKCYYSPRRNMRQVFLFKGEGQKKRLEV